MRPNANIHCATCLTPCATWSARAARGGICPTICRPGPRVYQQWARWRDARVFEALMDDLRAGAACWTKRGPPSPRAVILDSRTLQSTPESGHRAGYDGAKRRKGSKVHVAVDTLGHLLAAVVTPANEHDRAQVDALWPRGASRSRAKTLQLAYVDQGYTGEDAGPSRRSARH